MPQMGSNPGYSSSNIPIEQIRSMRAQGLDNNQIIQTLQRDGYSSTDIFEAMNQVDMVSAGDPPIPSPAQNSSDVQGSGYGSSSSYGSDPGYLTERKPTFQFSGTPPSPSSYRQDVSNEELVEAIIDEKWNELVKDLNKVIEWKNSANNRILTMEQKVNDLRAEFDKLHTAILAKIGDYDKNITNVGADVKAMEKVFSKVLPVFTENVAELSRISKDFKKGPVTKQTK